MRIWMDLAVAVVLVSILVFGGAMIWELNKDAMTVEVASDLAGLGQQISKDQGCIACHTVDGSPGVGPSWACMLGSRQTLQDGSTVIIDEEYFIESVRRPAEKLVQGYPNVMPGYYTLDQESMDALLAFAEQLSEAC